MALLGPWPWLAMALVDTLTVVGLALIAIVLGWLWGLYRNDQGVIEWLSLTSWSLSSWWRSCSGSPARRVSRSREVMHRDR
jgi:hypothetical protein